MTALIFVTCPAHPSLLRCDDDCGYDVESVESARTLHAAEFPLADGKEAFVVITCELGGCLHRITFKASTVTEGRALAAGHNFGWYRTRRARNRLADACQYHLGSCCIAHARPGAPGVDPAAIFPLLQQEPTGVAPTAQAEQLDLFAEVA